MTEILSYIKSRYQETAWPFLKLSELTSRFGEQPTRTALNQLYAMKMIKKRMGAAEPIIEYLPE